MSGVCSSQGSVMGMSSDDVAVCVRVRARVCVVA